MLCSSVVVPLKYLCQCTSSFNKADGLQIFPNKMVSFSISPRFSFKNVLCKGAKILQRLEKKKKEIKLLSKPEINIFLIIIQDSLSYLGGL